MGGLMGMLIAVAATLMFVPVAQQYIAHGQSEVQGHVAAGEMSQIAKAADAYIQANYSAIVSATASGTQSVSMATLQSNGYIPASVITTNAYGQHWHLAIYQPKTGKLAALVYSVGGQAIALHHLPAVSAQAGAQGGFVPQPTGPYSADSGHAVGSYGGWNVKLSSFGASAKPGHLAALLYYQNGTQASDTLYRVAVPGQPQLNQMQTDIGMQGNSIDNATQYGLKGGGDLKADQGGSLELGAKNGVAAPSGAEPYVDFHYGNGAVQDYNVRLQNNANDELSVTGSGGNPANLTASGNVSAGGWIEAHNGYGDEIDLGGDSGGDDYELRLWNNNRPLDVWSPNGPATLGVWGDVSTNRVLLGHLQALGGTCSPNGEIANDGSGDVVACKGGTWQKIGAGLNSTYIAYGGQAVNGASSYAYCPSGYVATGGGYQITQWNGNNYQATGPDAEYPIMSGSRMTGWRIRNGGAQGGYMRAFAVCWK